MKSVSSRIGWLFDQSKFRLSHFCWFFINFYQIQSFIGRNSIKSNYRGIEQFIMNKIKLFEYGLTKYLTLQSATIGTGSWYDLITWSLGVSLVNFWRQLKLNWSISSLILHYHLFYAPIIRFYWVSFNKGLYFITNDKKSTEFYLDPTPVVALCRVKYLVKAYTNSFILFIINCSMPL